MHSQSLKDSQIVVATSEGSAVDDDSYLGYSVTTGDFDGNGEVDVAVGMPRGSGLVGRVSRRRSSERFREGKDRAETKIRICAAPFRLSFTLGTW